MSLGSEPDDTAVAETAGDAEVLPDLEAIALDETAPNEAGGAFDEIGPDEAPTPRPVRRSGGSMLGAAMMGLHAVFYGPAKEDIVVEIESSGDPPNLDSDGLDTAFGDGHRLVGPPLDDIKSRARRRRSQRR